MVFLIVGLKSSKNDNSICFRGQGLAEKSLVHCWGTGQLDIGAAGAAKGRRTAAGGQASSCAEHMVALVGRSLVGVTKKNPWGWLQNHPRS